MIQFCDFFSTLFKRSSIPLPIARAQMSPALFCHCVWTSLLPFRLLSFLPLSALVCSHFHFCLLLYVLYYSLFLSCLLLSAFLSSAFFSHSFTFFSSVHFHFSFAFNFKLICSFLPSFDLISFSFHPFSSSLLLCYTSCFFF